MTLGLAPRQADLFRSTAAFCEGRVRADSIYGILHRECFGLFPDDLPRAFRTADLWLIHAADCCSRYSLCTCCGVRY